MEKAMSLGAEIALPDGVWSDVVVALGMAI